MPFLERPIHSNEWPEVAILNWASSMILYRKNLDPLNMGQCPIWRGIPGTNWGSTTNTQTADKDWTPVENVTRLESGVYMSI